MNNEAATEFNRGYKMGRYAVAVLSALDLVDYMSRAMDANRFVGPYFDGVRFGIDDAIVDRYTAAAK